MKATVTTIKKNCPCCKQPINKRTVILNVEMTEYEADRLFSLLDCHEILKRAKSLRINFSPIDTARLNAEVTASSRGEWNLRNIT